MKDPQLISEILEAVEAAKTKEEKIALIKKHNSRGLRDVLRGALDPSIQWNLPLGVPKYEKAESHTDGTVPSNLIRRTNEFAYLFKGGPGDKIHPAKREALFLGLLESVAAEDGEVLVLMKDKKLHEKFPSITKEIVNSAIKEGYIK